MLEALLENPFMQKAALAGVLVSVVCGIIGVIIIEKKLVMMTGGIAHTSYGGVGLGYLLDFEPIIGAFVFAILAALGIGYINRKGKAASDVIIGLFWSLGMALGIIFFSLMPGYPPDPSTYLFGNILTVTWANLYFTGIITLIVVLAVVIFFNHWKAYLFDDEFAYIKGIKTTLLEYLLLILIAMTVVALIRVVGIILALALLTAPAATTATITNNLKKRMIYAIILGNVFCFLGLWISYEVDIASGAVIVTLSVVSTLASYGVKAIKAKRRVTGK
ncbi:MAG: metal ABC transporter permease [Clostridiales bacterium]|jgi:zinc transport system permease protein|nr:metal ABC transporter permease [Clostridiales bacterium]